MRYLVTGAAGFIGSAILGELAADGQNSVVGVDSLAEYYSTDIKNRRISELRAKNVAFQIRDVRDLKGRDLEGVDVIFHEAGQPGVRNSWGQEFDCYVRDNVQATQHLLELVKDSNVSRFIYASSSSVYGDAESYPTHESAVPAPRSPYGVTKLAAEHLCSLYAANFAVPTVSLRYFTVYGPGQRPDMAFSRFIAAALDGRSVTINGDGEQVREFTHVSDIVRANILAASADVPRGSVINLSGGSSVSINQVLDILDDVNGNAVRRDYSDPAVGDVFRTGGDTNRAKAWLSWSPKIDIHTGFKDQYSHAASRNAHLV